MRTRKTLEGMKYKEIKVSGKTWPVSLGTNALSEFLDDQKLSLMDMEKLGETMSLRQAVKLFYFGLKDGARKAKKEFELTIEEVGDLIDDFPGGWTEGLAKVMELFSDGMPAPSEKKVKAVAAKK